MYATDFPKIKVTEAVIVLLSSRQYTRLIHNAVGRFTQPTHLQRESSDNASNCKVLQSSWTHCPAVVVGSTHQLANSPARRSNFTLLDILPSPTPNACNRSYMSNYQLTINRYAENIERGRERAVKSLNANKSLAGVVLAML
jgi:hypothetical protein